MRHSGHLLGAPSLTSLELGGRSSGKGALGLAAGLARHLLIRHHDGLRSTGAVLHPSVHRLIGGRARLLGRPPATATPRRRSSRRHPTGLGGSAGNALGPQIAICSRGRAAGADARSRNRAPSAHRRSCRRGGRCGGRGRGNLSWSGCGSRSLNGNGACGAARNRRRGTTSTAITARSVVAAPYDHLHLSHLAPLGFKAVGHTAHTSIEGGDPQAKPQHGHCQHTETYGH